MYGTIPPFYSLGGGGGYGITGSPSAGWTFTKAAETGVAENIITLKVTDEATAALVLGNESVTDGVFISRVLGIGDGTNRALAIYGQGTTDTGSAALIRFMARIGSGSDVATRPLMEFLNNATTVASVSAKGAWTYTVMKTDGAAETLATWALDEEVTGSVSLKNNTISNARFSPMLDGVAGSSSTALSALTLRARITSADSGTTPVLVLDARKDTATSITTRPLVSVQNNGTEMAQFTAAGSFAVAYPLTHPSYTVATLPSAAISGQTAYVTNAAVAPCLAFSNGTNWKRCDNAATTVV